MEVQVEMLRFLTQPKRRVTTNLKIKNNQNCQETKQYGSPTTKELKTHSSRLVGVEEMGRSLGGEDVRQGSVWLRRWSHSCVRINQKEQLGSKTHRATQGSNDGK